MPGEILTSEKVYSALKSVKAPGARSNIVEANQIEDLEIREKSILLRIRVGELNPLIERSLRFQIEKSIQSLSSDFEIAIEFLKEAPEKAKNLIGTLIAVGSGKGGVGKSAVAVNLAAALQNLGYSVGILDCDIYGPSVPTMLKVENEKPMMLNSKIQPIEAYGLKVMSAGFFVEPGQSIVWRGPMIHKLIQQFVQDVDWNGTDVLIVDLPPGTGDAPLSLAQTIPLAGAVMVSTPQIVSLIDVHKGISMFHQVKVPILGVIENMSHFECPHCHEPAEIFDRGNVKKFCEDLGVPYLGDIPIEPKIRACSDRGEPFFLQNQDSPAGRAIQQIAKRIVPFIKTADEAASSELELKMVY